MAAPGRMMKMVGFLQAQNCSIAPGSWRHPAASTDYLGPDHFIRVARVLEEGKFHLAFFDDRLAMPDIYGRDHRARGARTASAWSRWTRRRSSR